MINSTWTPIPWDSFYLRAFSQFPAAISTPPWPAAKVRPRKPCHKKEQGNTQFPHENNILASDLAGELYPRV